MPVDETDDLPLGRGDFLAVVDNGLDGHCVAPVRFGFATLAREGIDAVI